MRFFIIILFKSQYIIAAIMVSIAVLVIDVIMTI